MHMLIVPVPVLTQKQLPGTRFTSDQPIELDCAPVRFPNGEELNIERMAVAAYWIQRHLTGGTIEIWNESTKRWESGTTPPQPQPLFFKDNRWKAMVVPIGQTDFAGTDKFSTISGFPKYFVKCTFKGRDGQGQEHEGMSPDSLAVEIRPLGEEQNARLFITPKDNPAAAIAIGLVLQDTSLTTERGKVVIAEEIGGTTIDLVSAGAQIQIRPSGEIILRPKVGESVRIAGNVLVEGTVTATAYLP
jgi:hypothetical protein